MTAQLLGALRVSIYGVFFGYAVYDLWNGPATWFRIAGCVTLFMCTVGWWTRMAAIASGVLMLWRTFTAGPALVAFLGILPWSEAFAFDALPRSEFFPEAQFGGAARGGLLLWDGTCGFCQRMLTALQEFVPRPFPARPFQEVIAELPDEVRKYTGRQMHWVRPEGGIVGGSQALIEVLAAGGRSGTSWLLATPLVRPITWAAYRIIASNRGAAGDLIGASCELKK